MEESGEKMIHFFTAEPSAVASRFSLDPYQLSIVNQAKNEGRLIRVEVGQFMSQPPFIWGLEIA